MTQLETTRHQAASARLSEPQAITTLSSVQRPLEARVGLPTWPITAMFALYPLWWFIGLADVAWIGTSAAMGLYLAMLRRVPTPKHFGIWLLFLMWMMFSVIELDKASRLLVFGYRASHYFAITLVLLYVYNARRYLTDRFITGSLTIFWTIVVVGGYLGMLFPTAIFRTPMSYILPGFFLNNELVNYMVIRRLAQFNPDAFVEIQARPSAPFLFTNNWGNAYSMLLPFVLAYLCKTYGERRFWVIAALVPLSFLPAIATLNRGMFLGLGVIGLYVSFRYALRGNLWVLVSALTLGGALTAGLLYTPAQDELNTRVEQSSTTEDRAEIYSQTIEAVGKSPLLGYGAPRPSANPNIPPVGTHGEFWTVMHSHGVPAVLFFTAFALYCFLASLRRHDAVGLLANTVILVGLVETLYYGFLPSGLYLLMIACGLATRGPVHAYDALE